MMAMVEVIIHDAVGTLGDRVFQTSFEASGAVDAENSRPLLEDYSVHWAIPRLCAVLKNRKQIGKFFPNGKPFG